MITRRKGDEGFSLIEMVLIILMLGILLPFILTPYITSAQGIGRATSIAAISYVARGHLEDEASSVDIIWPAAGAYPKPVISEMVNGAAYETAINAIFVDSNFAPTDGSPLNNYYLWLTVTTTRTATGESVVLSALKSKVYN